MARVLIIEDDPDARDVLRQLLDLMGHHVQQAPNGAEGVEMFRPESYDLVITDMVMPKQDGLDTIRELRDRDPNVRILAISGGAIELDANDCLQPATHLGARQVLMKPFGRRQLQAAVEDILND